MKKILILILVFISLLSCGNKENSKNEKIFTLNIGSEPPTIDPQLAVDVVAGTVNQLISEGLLRKTKDGKIQTGTAEKWTKSEDSKKWTFYIRKDAKWSNGDPITANNYKEAWIRTLDPKTASGYAYALYPIKNAEAFNNGKVKAEDVGIRVIDDKTLEVTLETPILYFEDLVTFPVYSPLNEKLFEKVGEKYFTTPETTVSSGPYILKEWVHDSKIVFTKNPNYWNKDNVKVDKIVFSLISDPAASLQAFKNGEVDATMITSLQAKDFENDPRLKRRTDGTIYYMIINNEKKGLNNSKIRKALLMAIDRGEISRTISYGNSVPARTFVPRNLGIKGLEKEFADEVPTSVPRFNPKEAKKLLEEGLKEEGLSELPTLEMMFNEGGNNKVTAEYIQESWRNLGVQLNLISTTFQERLDRTKQKDFDVVIDSWIGDFSDPITYLDLFITNGGVNYGSYSNPKYDNLVKIVKSSVDPKVRIPAMYGIEKIIAEDIPVAPLFHGKRSYLVNPRVKGFSFLSIGGEFMFDGIDIEDK